jgi:electron transport complex protein RnfG
MMNNKVFKLTAFLLIVCGISALLIAYVNDITVDRIAAQNAQALQEGYSEVYPEADEYAETEYTGSDAAIIDVVSAKKGGQETGVIYTVAPGGYGGTVLTLVGFDIETQKISGIKVLKQSETPGLGGNCTQPWFAARFAGKSAAQPLKVVKTETSSDQEVQAITAATITSTAVVTGINAAQADFAANYANQ